MSDPVVICECFARDGLQNEPSFLATNEKIRLIDMFGGAGFRRVEATSYSHPERVPAFRDASAVLAGIARPAGVSFKATCPNLHAVNRAITDAEAGYGADELSILASASESHTQKNLRTTRNEQWSNIKEMALIAKGRFKLVGVVSMALGSTVEGFIEPGLVTEDVARFADLGAQLVTIGDTTGMGNPASVKALFRRLKREVPGVEPVAHFHNTRGTALANCLSALEEGCRHFDSAMGGVGGHPAQYSYGGEGFTGNACTEDLVCMFEAAGVPTGIDLEALMVTSKQCENILGRPLHSMVARAGLGLISKRNR